MDTDWDKVKDYVANTYVSATLDFSSTYNKNILKKIANPDSSVYNDCADPEFASDSWHPSVSADKTIQCYVSGSDATTTECATSGDITGATSGCAGCMDGFNILNSIGAGSITSELTSRYTNVG